MRIEFSVKVMCDYRACTTVEELSVGADEIDLDTFGKLAKKHFRKLGWRVCEPYPRNGNRCPRHADESAHPCHRDRGNRHES